MNKTSLMVVEGQTMDNNKRRKNAKVNVVGTLPLLTWCLFSGGASELFEMLMQRHVNVCGELETARNFLS
jgi:hypothetical protein